MEAFKQQQQQQDVAWLNNQGLLAMGFGRFDEATRLLYRAAHVLESKLRVQNDPSDIASLSLAPQDLSHMVPRARGQSCADHNTLSFHSSAFMFVNSASTTTTTTTTRSKGVPELISSALLYNLGVASHLKGLNNENNAAKGVRSAARFYGMAAAAAHRLGDQEAAPPTCPQDARCQVLLAVYNNWAHASFQLFDTNACVNCREALRYLLSLSSSSVSLDQQEQPQQVEQVPQEQQDENSSFVMNVILLECRTLSAPAA